MKTNAPEKIYLIRNISTPTSLNTANDCHEKYLQEWYKEKEKDADIEYTRTDAFIEKALKFLDGCIPDYMELKHANVDTFMDIDNERFIEDFKNYMKGE